MLNWKRYINQSNNSKPIISMKKLLTLCLVNLVLFAKAQTSGYQVGDVVADFSLKNINGKTVSLADYKSAKGFIIVFTCNTCPYAVAYEDRIRSRVHWCNRQRHRGQKS